MDDSSGKIFLGRFRVDDLLSRGPEFSRYRGFDLKRNLMLSINVFQYRIQPDPSVLCFQQNNLTLQTIMHPNIVPFYGLFEDEGKSFVIEKFVEGLNLGQILQQRNAKPMPPMDALVYIKSLATALEYLHGFGLVHATVNPSNIRATRDGSVMLANFGFARNADRPMTQTGVFGLPLCQAPEQLRGENIFPSTDVYALGILFYEFLTGVHPLIQIPSAMISSDPHQEQLVRQAHLEQEPSDARRLIPNLPSGLSQTLLTAISKDPKDRYQSVQEMLEISCAVLGVNPNQVADRIGTRPSVASTQAIESEVPPEKQIYSHLNPPQVSPVAAGALIGTQVVPGNLIGGTQVVPGQPIPGTQVVPGGSWGAKSGTGFSQSYPASSQTGRLVSEKRARPKWLIPLIVGFLGVLFLCTMGGIWAGLPYLKDMITTATPTFTATLTHTPTNTFIPPSATSPILPTLPPVVPPTEPQAPPTIALPPSALPTEIPTPTAVRTAFKVTIRNELPESIFAFRDNTLMGTDPIPPGKYIYYLNIPGGQHYFLFCYQMNMTQCPVERQVNVNDDITITVQ